MSHSGYLGNTQFTWLAVLDCFDRDWHVEDFDSKPQPLRLVRMLYVSSFQAGIDRFITQSPLAERHADGLDFIRSRFYAPKKSNAELRSKIESALDGLRTTKHSFAEAFIADLICAMHSNAAMLSAIPIPDVREICSAFVPELAAPIIQLVANLRPHQELLPIPLTSIDRNSVTRFRAILDGLKFEQYSQSHAMLHDSDAGARSVLTRVRNSGAALLEESKGLLAVSPAVIRMLKLAPKIIDTIFGKLPGALGQIAGDLAQKRLEERTRIVIYPFAPWISAMRKVRRGHRET